MIQAFEDADVLVINTAFSKSPKHDNVFVVGEDIDLLVLLNALPSSSKHNVFFLKSGRGKATDVFYSSNSFRYIFSKDLLFLHAFSGCDTTSAVFGHGKNHFCTVIDKHPELQAKTKAFLDSDASLDELKKAGEEFLIFLYGGKPAGQNLEQLRYETFVKAAAKTKLNLSRLPPTSDAAEFHIMRTYQQVQSWLGIYKDPKSWGWESTPQGLFPLKASKDPAPDSILHTISCACKKGCRKACGCRKAGLKCSNICKHCSGNPARTRLLWTLTRKSLLLILSTRR